MRVLFAVDGSEGSLEAVRQVAPLVVPGKDQIALYCAPPSSRRLAARVPEALARARAQFADAVIDQARAHLPDAWTSAKVEVIVGAQDARQSIVPAAETWNAQLLVVGARGLSRLERLLLGSVSRAVVHGSKIPVWVARPRQRPSDSAGLNVLLACENPELGCLGAEVLRGLSLGDASTCRTLTIVPSMFAGNVPPWLEQQARSSEVEAMAQAWAREHDEELRRTRAAMEDFAAQLPACRRQEPLILEGEPSAAILATIAAEKTDLVVLGHKRQNWLATALLGRTLEVVLNYAQCSVLVVPHAGGGAPPS